MKILLCLLALLIIGLPTATTLGAQSGCADGTTANNNLTCNISLPAADNADNQFDGDLGDDVMTQESGIMTVNIDGDGGTADDLRGLGDGGNDIITNYGTVTASIAGDWVSGNGGDDTIYNYGQVNVNIMGDEVLGDGGNDTIVNAATVENAIHGEGGDDAVILTDGANGGDDHILLLDGGEGNDILIFRFADAAVRSQIETALAGQSAANGSITVGGQSYNWTDFESIQTETLSAADANRIKTSAPIDESDGEL